MRPNKRAQRKAENTAAALREFLIKNGHDPDAVENAFEKMPDASNDDKMLQAEGVLLHLLKPTRFISKTCKRPECGQVFGTSYKAVAYCSNNCRAKHLESQTGIRWNPFVDRYRNLEGEAPLVIGPQAYQTLIEFAKYILAENRIQITEAELKYTVLPPIPEAAQTHPQESHQQFSAPHTIPDISPQPSISLSHLDPANPFQF